MSIFNLISWWGPCVWTVQEERPLSAKERAEIKSAFISAGKFGKDVEFRLRNGKRTHTPLMGNTPDYDSLPVGKRVSLKKITVCRLSKTGEKFDIYRIKLQN